MAPPDRLTLMLCCGECQEGFAFARETNTMYLPIAKVGRAVVAWTELGKVVVVKVRHGFDNSPVASRMVREAAQQKHRSSCAPSG